MEDKPLGSVTRSLLTIKVSQLLKSQDSDEGVATLWKYCESQFNQLVQAWEGKNREKAAQLAEKISLVVNELKVANFEERLLKEVFLAMEPLQILDADLNILCLQHRLFPVPQWENFLAS